MGGLIATYIEHLTSFWRTIAELWAGNGFLRILVLALIGAWVLRRLCRCRGRRCRR